MMISTSQFVGLLLSMAGCQQVKAQQSLPVSRMVKMHAQKKQSWNCRRRRRPKRQTARFELRRSSRAIRARKPPRPTTPSTRPRGAIALLYLRRGALQLPDCPFSSGAGIYLVRLESYLAASIIFFIYFFVVHFFGSRQKASKVSCAEKRLPSSPCSTHGPDRTVVGSTWTPIPLPTSAPTLHCLLSVTPFFDPRGEPSPRSSVSFSSRKTKTSPS